MTTREPITQPSSAPQEPTFTADFNLYWRALEAALLIAIDALYRADMRLDHVIASQLRTMLSAVHSIRRAFVSGELGVFELRAFERMAGQLTVLRRVVEVWLDSSEALPRALDDADKALFALCSMCSQSEQRKTDALKQAADKRFAAYLEAAVALPSDVEELDLIDRCIDIGRCYVTLPNSFDLDPETVRASDWVLRALAYFEAKKVRDAAAAKATVTP